MPIGWKKPMNGKINGSSVFVDIALKFFSYPTYFKNFRCGHYDSAIDYAGEFKLPVSALATDSSFVPLLSGMFIKNVVSVNLKINGDFTSPFSLAISPSDANRGSRYQISFGDSFGTTTKECFHVISLTLL